MYSSSSGQRKISPFLRDFILLYGIPLIIFIEITQINVYGQNLILNGHISDASSLEPIPFVNVFFNNTTIGTTTDINGNYKIHNLDPGYYHLVISMVGYETVNSNIRLEPGKSLTMDFKLKESVTKLSGIEFVGKEDKQWNRNYRRFRKEFLGDKEGEIKYEFMNPFVLEFNREAGKNIFRAVATAPLEIINYDLGYKIFFYLQNFEQNSGSLIFYGQTRFEEIENTNSLVSDQIEKNRFETYRGSIFHFFRALLENSYKSDGFLAYHVPGINIVSGNNTFYDKTRNDYREINIMELVSNSRHPEEKLIHFNDLIIVIYTYEYWEKSPYQDLPYQVSWIRLTGNSLRIHKSGFVYNPVGYELLGYRSGDRVLQMLPFEYIQILSEQKP